MVYINPFNVIYLYNITQRDTIEKEKVFYQYFTSDLVVTPPPQMVKNTNIWRAKNIPRG